MMKMRLIYVGMALLGLLAQGSPARAAQGNEGPHGGDEIGLEFRVTAQSVLDDIRRNNPELHSLIEMADPETKLNQAIILAVDTPLKVSVGGRTQDSIAVNDARSNMILVNRVRWTSLSDPRIKLGVALHEVLGLAGIEETGSYPVSSRYLAMLGLSGSLLVPSADRDRTYMSCLDTSSALYLVTISPKGVLTTQVRGIENKTLANIQAVARGAGVPNPEQVVGLSVSVKTQFYLGSIQPFDNCRFDRYNRFVLACDSDFKWFYYPDLPKETRFEYADGTRVSVPNGLRHLSHSNVIQRGIHGVDDKLNIALALDSSGQLNLSIDSATCR